MGNDYRKRLLWKDRKRVWGMPLGTTSYEVHYDKVVFTEGLLGVRENDVYLRDIKDVSAGRTFTQFVFGVGTVFLTTYDNKHYRLENVKDAQDVKKLVSAQVEEQKNRMGSRFRDYLMDWGRHPGDMW